MAYAQAKSRVEDGAGLIAGRAKGKGVLAYLPPSRSFLLCGSFGFVLDCRGRPNCDILAQPLHGYGADAVYILQINYGFERTILLAVIDNRLGFGRPDSLQRFQFRLGSSVDVDCGERCARKCE